MITASLGGHNADGEPIAVLAIEAPMKLSLGGRTLSKQELERLHLEKYRFDALALTGELPFDEVTQVEPGPDPPDFRVATNRGDVGTARRVPMVSFPDRRSLRSTPRQARPRRRQLTGGSRGGAYGLLDSVSWSLGSS